MMRCCSFNVRLDVSEDGEHAWPHRRELFVSTVRDIDPDVIGLQEPLAHQYEEIRASKDGFAWYGIGRKGDQEGEFSPLGWRHEQLETTERDTKWLSPTSDVVGSVGWDAAFPRIVSRIRLTDSGSPVVVYNTHFDHEGERARAESARLLTEWVDREPDPVILLGDFNCEPGSDPYSQLTTVLHDARELAAEVSGPLATFHGFSGEPTECIDHIFVSEGVAVERFETVDYSVDSLYPSDHFPVVADVRFDG